jgi:hypothetical protein
MMPPTTIPPDDHDHPENVALDALIASFNVLGHDSDPDDQVPPDDPAILSDEDRAAIAGLGDDLVDRLLAAQQREGGR